MNRLLPLLCAALLLVAGSASAPAQQARRAGPANWLATVAITPEGGFRQGSPNAPVKLIEYGSRTCPTCGRFAAEGVAPLRSDYVATGKVSYEYRDYLIHGPPDFALALLNQCVAPARFFPVLDAIYANQPVFAERLEKLIETRGAEVEAWQKLPPAQTAERFADALGFIPFMKAQGLPEAAARRCLADRALIERIARTNADAVNVHGVQGTPTFIVNGRRVSASSWDRLLPELWANGA